MITLLVACTSLVPSVEPPDASGNDPGTPSGTPSGTSGATGTGTPGTSPTGTGTPGSTGSTPTSPGTEACPPGVVCVDALPFSDSADTRGEASDLAGYACAPGTDESGPEVVYRVTTDRDGLLVARVSGLTGDVDVDVHVLESLDPGDCVDRGHWTAGAYVPAGTWYVVVDSWVDDGGAAHDGPYDLDIGLTAAADWLSEGLDAEPLDTALWAWDLAKEAGETDRAEYAILDFGLPSTEPRMFVFDLATQELLLNPLATHGIGSQDPGDLTMASTFSNTPGSNMSSLGLARAAETYWGSNGYSLRLDGLDPGFNTNIRDRAVVIHAADYATQDFVDTYGYLGRSEGCPAVAPEVHEDLIDTLADGALLWSYAPQADFVSGSDWLVGY